MKTIWFVYPYGPIPGEDVKDMRYIRIGRYLAKKYKCVWWTSNFFRRDKVFRSSTVEKREIQKNIEICLIPTTAFYRNISLRRVVFEIIYSRNLEKEWSKEKKPDLIITSGTGILTAFRPVWPYIKDGKTKAIYDIMDIHLINSYFKKRHKMLYPFVSLLMWVNSIREKSFYHNVDAVTGLGRNQLGTAKLRTGKREIPSCLLYNGINVGEFREKMKQQCLITLPEKKDGWIWCVYAGTLGPSYDIPALIKCAKKCGKAGKKIRFIVAGTGDFAEDCRSAGLENFTYLGYVDNNLLPSLYAKCDVGLSIYSEFSTVDMPDKFYDYTAAGLAIVNSLNGEVKDHIESNKLGVQYQAGDDEDLYRKVCRFESPEFLSECKNNSWRIGGEFDFNKQLSSLEELIDKLLAT